MSNLKETLELLAALQDVDKKMFYLELSKGDLPKLVTHLKNSILAVENQIDTIRNTIKEAGKERVGTENLVELAQEKLKKYQNQLYDVTSNKEYDAITHEIELKNKEIDEGESNILENIQLNEEKQSQLNEQEQELKQLKTDLKSKAKELNTLTKKTEKEELKLNHQREKLIVRIKNDTLSRYDRIRKAKSGIAVVPIKRDACGGCFKSIPPQKIVEVGNLERLIQCDVCGRILISEEKLDTIPL